MIDIIVESLLRASTHGAVAIAVVLVGCHVFRKSISESTECWLWRLVFVQMLVLIFVVFCGIAVSNSNFGIKHGENGQARNCCS